MSDRPHRACSLPVFEDIEAAARLVAPHILHTPLLFSPAIDRDLSARVFFKPECLQPTGSFKVRGAFNRLLSLTPHERERGVVAWSAGNHGQALAYAGYKLGIATVIVMPAQAPRAKIEGTKRWGGEVVLYDRDTESREDIGARIATERGATIVPPYDDAIVVAGQGTVGLEVAQQMNLLGGAADLFLCPTGGGGLIAGSALALARMSPATIVRSVEPERYDDTRKSLEAGKLIANAPGPRSICDALMTVKPGQIPFAINRAALAPGIAVSDKAVEHAMGVARAELHLVVEPGGAAALAAILDQPDLVRGRCAVIAITGGNSDQA